MSARRLHIQRCAPRADGAARGYCGALIPAARLVAPADVTCVNCYWNHRAALARDARKFPRYGAGRGTDSRTSERQYR